MKARIKWIDHMGFVGESGSGHSVVMDASEAVGGRDLGFRPMEMVLIGLGGCTAIDIIVMLEKAGEAVTDCVIEMSAERAEEAPQVFTRIHLQYIVTGRGLLERRVWRAIKMSAEKYCSVSRMLEHTAEISHDLTLVEA